MLQLYPVIAADPPGAPILMMNPGNSHVIDLSGNSISIVVNSNSERIGVKAGQDAYLECIEPTSDQNNLNYDIITVKMLSNSQDTY